MTGEDQNDPIEFPYLTLDEALQDDFQKIGGRPAALKFLRQGYKQTEWRRRTERARILREIAEDKAFAEEQKKLGRRVETLQHHLRLKQKEEKK